MRHLIVLSMLLLTACAGTELTTPPAKPLKAQRDPSEFSCPDIPIASYQALRPIVDAAAKAQAFVGITVEEAWPAHETCRCRLAIVGAAEYEAGRVSGPVFVPPRCTAAAASAAPRPAGASP